MRLAETLARDHRQVDDAFQAELRAQFDEAELVELYVMIGQYIALGRMLVLTGAHKAACEIYPTGD